MKFTEAIKQFFKKYMIAGTAVLIPLMATYLILRFIIVWSDDLVISLLPPSAKPEIMLGHRIPGLGLLATLVIIFLTGLFTRLYIGKKLLQLGDYIISKIPLGRSIYGGIKEFLGTILTRDHDKFKDVVVVEYPRRGCWVIGFVTGDPIKEIQDLDAKKWVNIFVPTTPNPTSGFLIITPEEDTIPLSLSVEEAFKLVISGGIVQDKDKPKPAKA